MPTKSRSPNGVVKPKIPLRRVPSDSCAVVIGQVLGEGGATVDPGTPYYVHQGEWVEYMPIGSIGNLLNLMKSLAAATGTSPEGPDVMTRRFNERCAWLSEQLVAWNWTDLFGNPLPQPYRQVDVLMGLTNAELVWLITHHQLAETQGERKNG